MNETLKKRITILFLIILMAFMTMNQGTISAFETRTMIAKGKIENIEGNTVTLNDHKKYEPASENASVPEWATLGTQVKISYYTQNYTNYYHEIVKQGERLQMEKEMLYSREKPR